MNTYCLLLCFCVAAQAAAQNKVTLLDDAGTNPGLVIDQLQPPPPPQPTGTQYLVEEWLPGNADLAGNRKLRNYPLRYDLANHLLEVKTVAGVKVCALNALERFSWLTAAGDTARFLNKGLVPDAQTLTGTWLWEQVLVGEATLLAVYKTEVLEPVYVTGIDVGRKNIKIIKKTAFYLSVGGQLHGLQPGYARNAPALGRHAEAVLAYARQNHLKFTNRTDLKAITLQLNLLMARP